MYREYRPHLDDDMTRIMGNRKYERDLQQDEYDASQRRYEDAIHSTMKPAEMMSLPLGKGIKHELAARYLKKHSKPISRQHMLYKLAKRGSMKHAMKLSGGAANPLYLARQFPNLPYSDIEMMAGTYGGAHPKTPHVKGTNYHLAKAMLQHPEMAEEDLSAYYKALPKSYAAQRAAMKRALKPKKVHKEELPAAVEEAIEGTGMQQKLLMMRELARSGDKVAKQKYRAYKRLIEGGLIAARGIKASPAGGALGAVAAMVAPLIIKGVKELAKRIKVRRGAQGGFLRTGVYMPGSQLADTKIPTTAKSFWHQVFRIANRQIPMFFSDPRTANTLARYFVDKHGRHLFGEVQDIVLKAAKEKNGKRLSVGDIMKPLIAATVQEADLPKDAGDALLQSAEAQEPAGSGIVEQLFGLLKSPEAKMIAKSAASALIPRLKGKLKAFIGKKIAKRSPKAAKVLSDVADKAEEALMSTIADKEIPKSAETVAETAAAVPIPLTEPATETKPAEPKLSQLSMTPLGSGPASGDAFTRGGMYAGRVYELAKKPSGH